MDASPGAPPLPIRALKEPVVLAEDIDADGEIGDAGIERTATAVSRILQAARRYEIESFYAFVTAAIRDAPNRESVLDGVERAAGIRPQFLTGAQEARLTYLAVRRWYGWRAGPLLVLDIGGGSMELALGRDDEPELALSLPLGAGRLTRAYLRGDPPDLHEVGLLREHIEECRRSPPASCARPKPAGSRAASRSSPRANAPSCAASPSRGPARSSRGPWSPKPRWRR